MEDVSEINKEMLKEIAVLKQNIKELELSKAQLIQTVEELQRSDIKLRTVYDALDDAVMLMDENGFLECNKAALEIFGYKTREGFCSTPPAGLSPPAQPCGTDSRALMDNHIETALKNGRHMFEWTHRRTDTGETFLSDVILTAMVLNNKPVLQVTVRDTTVRKRAEESLRKSEERFRELAELLPEVVFETDIKGILTFINMKAFDNFGYTMEDIEKGISVLDIVAADDRKRASENMQRIINGKKTGFNEYMLCRKDGSAFPSIIHSTIIFHDGKPVGFRGFVVDITNQKRAEKKLRDSYEQMRMLSAHIREAREKERTSIARELHDVLGQILTVINMDLTWMNKKIPYDKKELHDKLSSTRTLIKQAIKTVQKVSSGLRPVILDDFGITAAISSSIKEFQEQTGIAVGLAIDQAIEIDRETGSSIYRIFQEALTNVMRHAEATKLDVFLRRNTDCIQLIVKDNGRGITKEEITDKGSLGILGMKERAAFIGGHLEISGSKGLGTKIMIELPIKKSEIEL